jgi:GNAT superfamily N-acetyltransferase
MQTKKDSPLRDEFESAFAEWAFMPYSRLYDSRTNCAQAITSGFNFTNSFSEDGSVWLSHYGDAPEDWFSGLRFLPLETEILGQRTARLEIFLTRRSSSLSNQSVSVGTQLLEKVHTVAREHQISHISCTSQAGDSAVSNALESSGYRLTDSIVSNHLPISSNIGTTDPNISEAEPQDYERLKTIAYNAFSDRTQNINRFNSDPDLDCRKVGNLYSRFVQDACSKKHADLTLVYKENGVPAGFMTFRSNQIPNSTKAALGQAILSAVDPNFQGRGIYRRLLIQGGLWLAERGMTHIEGRTQLSNYRVIHVWQTLGAELSFAYHTMHRKL